MHSYIDMSASTKKGVIRPRVLPRVGILLHETIGNNSLAYLQGGSLAVGNPVSADYLLGRTGEIYQLTPPGWFAWHSGVARWRDYQEGDRSINQGFIEIENNPTLGQKIDNLQYIALGFLVRRLIMAWNIDVRNVVGHAQVALPSGRKSDPATLNWVMLTSELVSPSMEQSYYQVRGELS
jgi:N-acetylmuramoyl-L-alanine amidase